MYTLVDVKQYRESDKGTDLVVSVPGMRLGGLFQRKKIKNAEIRFDDGRHISAEQRKKAYSKNKTAVACERTGAESVSG